MNTIATEVGNFKRGQASNSAMDAFLDDAGSIYVCVGGANAKQINAGDGVDELSTNAGKPQCDCTLDESSDYTSLYTQNCNNIGYGIYERIFKFIVEQVSLKMRVLDLYFL